MPKSTITCNNLLKLLFNAVAWANVADNAAASPLTNLYVSLHTADPGVGNSQLTNEVAYTNYLRIAIVRTAVGWTVATNTAINAALAHDARRHRHCIGRRRQRAVRWRAVRYPDNRQLDPAAVRGQRPGCHGDLNEVPLCVREVWR